MGNQPPFKPDARLLLNDLLIIYYGLAMAHLDAAGAISPEAAMESIPGQVYSLCVRANWIEHPDPGWGEWNEEDGAPVELGEFLVPTKFKEAWMLTLKDALDDMVAFSMRRPTTEGRTATRENGSNTSNLWTKGRWTDEEIGFEAKLDTQTIVRYKQGVRGHPANLKKSG